MKKGTTTHLFAEGVKFSAWRCQPSKARLDNLTKDRRQGTCKDCLEVPMRCGPLTSPAPRC